MSKLYVVLQRPIYNPDNIDVNGPFIGLMSAERFEHDAYTIGYETCIQPMITRNTSGKANGSHWIAFRRRI